MRLPFAVGSCEPEIRNLWSVLNWRRRLELMCVERRGRSNRICMLVIHVRGRMVEGRRRNHFGGVIKHQYEVC